MLTLSQLIEITSEEPCSDLQAYDTMLSELTTPLPPVDHIPGQPYNLRAYPGRKTHIPPPRWLIQSRRFQLSKMGLRQLLIPISEAGDWEVQS